MSRACNWTPEAAHPMPHTCYGRELTLLRLAIGPSSLDAPSSPPFAPWRAVDPTAALARAGHRALGKGEMQFLGAAPEVLVDRRRAK